MSNDNEKEMETNFESLASSSLSSQHIFVVNNLEQRIRQSFSDFSKKEIFINKWKPNEEILNDIEKYSKLILVNIDNCLRELRGSLFGMTDLTIESLQSYNNSISNTCDIVDIVIKNSYSVLAKVCLFYGSVNQKL